MQFLEAAGHSLLAPYPKWLEHEADHLFHVMLRVKIHRVLPPFPQYAAVLTHRGRMFLALAQKQPFCKAIHSYQSTAKLRMYEALLLVSLHGIVSGFCDNCIIIVNVYVV